MQYEEVAQNSFTYIKHEHLNEQITSRSYFIENTSVFVYILY